MSFHIELGPAPGSSDGPCWQICTEIDVDIEDEDREISKHFAGTASLSHQMGGVFFEQLLLIDRSSG